MKRRLMCSLFGRVRTAAAVAVIAALAFVLLGSPLAPHLVGLARNVVESLTARTVTTVATGPALVQSLQGLNRLETARQTSQHVVESVSEGLPLPQFLAGDKILMVIETEAVVGIDLSRLSPQDVRLEGQSAVIRLPEPEVLSVRVEDGHSRVYDRQRGWLVFKPNPDLERQARLKAQADARRGALEGEAMEMARANAEKSLRSLLAPLGLRDVQFQWGVGPVTDGGGEAASPAG